MLIKDFENNTKDQKKSLERQKADAKDTIAKQTEVGNKLAEKTPLLAVAKVQAERAKAELITSLSELPNSRPTQNPIDFPRSKALAMTILVGGLATAVVGGVLLSLHENSSLPFATLGEHVEASSMARTRSLYFQGRVIDSLNN